MDELKAAFDAVKAEEGLKASTKNFLSAYPFRRRAYALRLVPAMLCVILLLGCVWLYYTPVVQISVEINPHIKLTMNRFARVIRAEGENPDGEAVLEELQLQHLRGPQAVECILCQPTVVQLLEEGETLSVGVIGDVGTQTEQLLAQMEDCVATVQHSECYHITPDEQQQAQAAGMSCGKYRKWLELQELDPTVTTDEIQNMTMGQIKERIAELETEGQCAEETDASHGSSHQHRKGQEKKHGK